MADNYEAVLASVLNLTPDEKNQLFRALQLEHAEIKSLGHPNHFSHECHICRSKRDEIVCDGCLHTIGDWDSEVEMHECSLCRTEFSFCKDMECYKDLLTAWQCECWRDYPYPGFCIKCALKLNEKSIKCGQCGNSTDNPHYRSTTQSAMVYPLCKVVSDKSG
jgi:hypothetical protein